MNDVQALGFLASVALVTVGVGMWIDWPQAMVACGVWMVVARMAARAK